MGTEEKITKKLSRIKEQEHNIEQMKEAVKTKALGLLTELGKCGDDLSTSKSNADVEITQNGIKVKIFSVPLEYVSLEQIKNRFEQENLRLEEISDNHGVEGIELNFVEVEE